MMTERILEVSRRLGGGDDHSDGLNKKVMMEISMVGGFQDEPGKSEELSLALFKELVRSRVTYVLGELPQRLHQYGF